MISSQRVTVVVAGVLAAPVLLVGCGSSDSSSPASSASPTSPAPAAIGTTPPATGAPDQAGTPVAITETEYSIGLDSTQFKAGTYTFEVRNVGSIVHALTIDGPGVEDETTGTISPGASGTVTVTLRSGTYDVYCPVGNHKMEGMDQSVTVA